MMDINLIFRRPIAEPKTYNIQLHEISDPKDLFHAIMEIYKRGCVILFGDDETSFQITRLTEERQFIMKQYMRSMGILPKIWMYTEEDINDTYIRLEDTLKAKSIKGIKIIKKFKPNGNIQSIQFTLKKQNEKEYLTHLHTIVKNDNDFFNVLNIIVDKQDVSFYKCTVKIFMKLYVLRFFLE